MNKYKYESLILPLIKERNRITDKGDLYTHCSWCDPNNRNENDFTFHISLDKGLYKCDGFCRAKR